MTLKLTLTALALGILGFILTWGGWHLYQDHLRVDQIWQLELLRDQAARQPAARPPAPMPAAPGK